jgi:molybdenum cofactor sulfurtransferase
VQPGVCLQVVGPCGRCDMVSIDQSTGQRRGSQLLSLLARERRVGGKLQFGVLLANTAAGSGQQLEQERVSWLHVGDAVLP